MEYIGRERKAVQHIEPERKSVDHIERIFAKRIERKELGHKKLSVSTNP